MSDNDIAEFKLPPGTVVKVNGIPLEVTHTVTVVTVYGNRVLLPCEVINHTVTVAVREEEAKKRNERKQKSDRAFLVSMTLLAMLVLVGAILLLGVVK